MILSGSLQEWFNCTATSAVRSWTPNTVAPPPFHAGAPSALRSLLPIRAATDATFVKCDLAHTYAIAGYGKDQLASTLIFLCVHCNIYGTGAWERQLEEAYGEFRAWCARNRVTTSITEFSKTELKVQSFLAMYLTHGLLWCVACMHMYAHCICGSRPMAQVTAVPKGSWERL